MEESLCSSPARPAPVCIPGAFNRFLRLLTVVFPPRVVAKAIHYRLRVTRKRPPLPREQ